jgi:hypothetical protein
VAWTWHQDGIVFNVVANGIGPGEAGEFAAALSAVQQDNPTPGGTSTLQAGTG